MPEQVDIVVAGHVCLDVTPRMYEGGSTVAEIFRPGKLINVGPAVVSTGGPVSNTGLPLRRLGMNVRLVGKCGDDMFGRALIECLRREAPGAEAGMAVIPGETTSYTVVVNPPGLDRMFLHCPGANDTFTAADIDAKLVQAARLFHFGYPPLMARTYQDGGAELVRIFELARGAGATTSLDTAYPDPAAPAGKVDWKTLLARVLPLVDVFTPSFEELLFMLRRNRFNEMLAEAKGELLDLLDPQLLCELGNACIDAGTGVVLIKCGYLGVYVRTAGRGRLEQMGRAAPADISRWANRELFEPSYKPDKIVSTTGAGDCAIAGFLAALVRGLSLEDALRCACAVGAQNLDAADSVSGVRDWDYTLAQIRSHEKNEMPIPLHDWRHIQHQRHYAGPSDGMT